MTPEQADALSPKLPRGWLEKTHAVLARKGVQYTSATISRVKNAHFQNADVEEALLVVAAEEASRLAEVDARIANIPS